MLEAMSPSGVAEALRRHFRMDGPRIRNLAEEHSSVLRADYSPKPRSGRLRSDEKPCEIVVEAVF
jgi:hypothetical protein